MNALEGRWRSSIRDLQDREAALEQQVSALKSDFSGLLDIDLSLQLIVTKLTLAIRLLDLIARDPGPSSTEMGDLARKASVEGAELLESLSRENVSLDQKELILESENYEAALELFHHLILQGGAAFFDGKIEDRRTASLVAGVMTDAIQKFAPSDSDYAPLVRVEKLPRFLRKLANTFFPILAPENQADPPLGIDEGEQLIYHARRIRMPLSQAIHYYEEELLPQLEERLRDSPGDFDLQREIDRVERLVSEYRHLRFIPRSTPGSTPVILGKDFYTESITEFTANGELMVSVELPVSINSGTNLERLQEMVQADVTRRLAGRGVCADLDEQYRRLKSLESGIHGSSRLPSYRLDISAGFSALKHTFPAMRHLENKTDFTRLLALVASGERAKVRRLLADAILTPEARRREISE